MKKVKSSFQLTIQLNYCLAKQRKKWTNDLPKLNALIRGKIAVKMTNLTWKVDMFNKQ